MSVTPNQIVIYGSANMPEADGVTVGGAVDFTKRVSFYDVPSAMALDIVSSSGSDIATKIQVSGRDPTGAVVTPAAATLNGTTVVSNAIAPSGGFQRLIAGVITGGAIAGLSNPGGTPAVGDVAAMGHTPLIGTTTAGGGAHTVLSPFSTNTLGTTPPTIQLATGDGATIGGTVYAGLGLIIRITGGTGAGQMRMIIAQYSSGAYGPDRVAVNRDWSPVLDNTSQYVITYGFLFDILPNPVTAITRIFATSQADVPSGSTRIFYEKVFWVNTNASTALLSAQIQVLSETGALPIGAALDLALCTALNDTATAANRQTLPTGIGSYSPAQPNPINVPAPGNLPNGNSAAVAEGGWLRLTLAAGTTVYQGTADLRTTGATT